MCYPKSCVAITNERSHSHAARSAWDRCRSYGERKNACCLHNLSTFYPFIHHPSMHSSMSINNAAYIRMAGYGRTPSKKCRRRRCSSLGTPGRMRTQRPHFGTGVASTGWATMSSGPLVMSCRRQCARASAYAHTPHTKHSPAVATERAPRTRKLVCRYVF